MYQQVGVLFTTRTVCAVKMPPRLLMSNSTQKITYGVKIVALTSMG